MCFCFTSNELSLFFGKNGDLPKRVVDLPRERDTFRNKIMEIVEDSDDKKFQQQQYTLEVVEDFACESKFIHFSLVVMFLHFSSFFYIFSFFLFHFLSFSFIFFHFLCLCWVLKNLFFLEASISLRFLLTILMLKINFWAHLGCTPLWALLSFSSYFFSLVFVFFLLSTFSFFLIFCSFLHFLII